MRERYPTDGERAVRIARGEEMGRFNMGSTVIVVNERPVDWRVRCGDSVRVRAAIGMPAG